MNRLNHLLLSRPFIIVEFFLLCIAVPGYIIFTKSAPFMFAFLWGAALYGFLILRFVYHDHLKQIWKWKSVTWENMKPILLRWVIACAGMLVFIWFYDPERMFRLALERPQFIPFLMIAYPVLSALPQEFIFCSFFFERYKPFFGSGMRMVAASMIVFAYAHILYINPVAPTLSLIGGLIFALTYRKTNSLALVTIEHGLYGNFLFVVGLGYYFHGGSVVH
ncbi:MAG: CPBP family intramembrane metalloprotease [Alphaproteobacteria bacterium]|nr:CPBP family intramembrane metalloprotease [Alphaproteobacteria bacterium]MCD8526069.1 CPBP family intramembrane metalloprotease [Alphaproteobacteria bacterium]